MYGYNNGLNPYAYGSQAAGSLGGMAPQFAQPGIPGGTQQYATQSIIDAILRSPDLVNKLPDFLRGAAQHIPSQSSFATQSAGPQMQQGQYNPQSWASIVSSIVPAVLPTVIDVVKNVLQSAGPQFGTQSVGPQLGAQPQQGQYNPQSWASLVTSIVPAVLPAVIDVVRNVLQSAGPQFGTQSAGPQLGAQSPQGQYNPQFWGAILGTVIPIVVDVAKNALQSAGPQFGAQSAGPQFPQQQTAFDPQFLGGIARPWTSPPIVPDPIRYGMPGFPIGASTPPFSQPAVA